MINTKLCIELENYYSRLNIDESLWSAYLLSFGVRALSKHYYEDAIALFLLSWKYGNKISLEYFTSTLGKIVTKSNSI